MQPDFLIVGGGVVGLTSALALLQQGYSVTVVERGTVGNEASWAGAGILSPLCPWDYRDAVTRLARHGMDRFEAATAALHADTGIDPEYQRSGMLLLPPCDTDRGIQWCQSHNFPLQQVGLADRVPGQQGTGLLLPDVAQVRNPRLMQALRKRVDMLGGTILEQQEALGFDVSAGRVTTLNTAKGKLGADRYIVSAGAWSKMLLGSHALGMDIYPVRGQILLFKFDAPPLAHILLRESLYLIPRRDGHVLVGSTLEDTGFDKSTTAEARDSLLRRVYELFPAWRECEPVRQWAGFRPGSPDNIPVIGRHPGLANLYANTGHFRYGVTMSFASAALLLNEVEGRQQPFSTEEYRWH